MQDKLSDVLDMLTSQNPMKTREQIVRWLRGGCDFYAQQAAPHFKTYEGRLQATYSMLLTIDEEMKKLPEETRKEIKCRAGCAHCCKQQVMVSRAEAELIIDQCKENNVEIDTEHLEKQVGMSREDYRKGINSRCVFLGEDDLCSIYPIRPVVCRKYLVVSDPELCNVQVNHEKNILSVFMVQAEMMAFGLALAGGEENDRPLPEVLLEIINEQGQS